DQQYELRFADAATAQQATEWLEALSNGFVQFDPEDVYAKLPGAVVIENKESDGQTAAPQASDEAFAGSKPYYVGQWRREARGERLPAFEWEEPEDAPLRRTSLYDTHVEMGARMVPFGGWEMPVWYSSVS